MSQLFYSVFVLNWIYSFSLCYAVTSLSFIPIPDAQKDPIVYITNKEPRTVIDASASHPRTVYFAERSDFVAQSLKFACEVNSQLEALQSIFLCFRPIQTDPHKTCTRISFDTPTGTVTALKSLFNYRVDRFKGVNFTLNVGIGEKFDNPIAGLFSCSITSGAESTIISNEIELLDAVYYMRFLPTKSSEDVTKVQTINSQDFPQTFRCADSSQLSDWPEWMNTLSGTFGIYEWGYCTVKGRMNAHSCMTRREGIRGDSAITMLNGTLYILDKSFFYSGDRALMCKTKDRNAPVRTFAGSVQTTDISTSKMDVIIGGIVLHVVESGQLQKLRPLTKLEQNYSILRDSKLEDFSLTALYQEPDQGSEFQWLKNGVSLPLTGASKFSYLLPLMADVNLEGVYQLQVTSKSDLADRLVFTYYLQVTYPPTFTNPDCLADLFYVMRGAKYSTVCPFTARNKPRLLVGVNMYEAETSDALRDKLKQQSSLNRPLSELDINFKVIKSMDTQVQPDRVAVDVNSMMTGQNFELVVRLESIVGESHIYSSIKVIPIPKLVTSPYSSDCSEKCDIQPYNVSCTLDPELIKRWEELFDIVPITTWVIQNQWLSEEFTQDGIGRFMRVYPSSGGSTLAVWPQGLPDPHKQSTDGNVDEGESDGSESQTNPTGLKQFIFDHSGNDPFGPSALSLRCRIQLMVRTKSARFSPPPGLQRPMRRGKVGSTESARRMYDTTWETDLPLVQQLSATRRFTPDVIEANISHAWVAGLVIGAVIIFAVVTLSIWLFTRDRGETYMLYDKEREHGNDPIQEMKEAEGFKTYQRQEEQPLASSRYSLHDGSMHVESDDDGELDQYEANFNEEGSFIHGYTTDPALPPPTSPPDVSIAGMRHSTPQNYNVV